MVKKYKNKSVSRKFIYIIVGIQAIVFAITIAALFIFTSVRTQNWNIPSTEFVYMMDSAISSLTREASGIPDNTYQYVPEAKLRFKTINDQKIVYHYNQEDLGNNIKSSITISSNTIKRDSIAELYQYNQGSNPKGQQLFDRVAGVQNCNKIYVLSYDDNIIAYHGEEYKLQNKLNIGDKSLYLWKHTGTLCNAGNIPELVDELEQVLLSAESY